MSPPDLSSRVDDLPSQPRGHAVFVATGVASRKIRAALDRFAVGVVWCGGIATIVSILGIFVYLLIEVAPLFSPPKENEQAKFLLKDIVPPRHLPTAVGVDEYQEVAYVIHGGRVEFYQLPSGTPIPVAQGALPSSDQVTAVARSNGRGHRFAFGTRDGQVMPVDIELRPKFDNGRRTIIPTLSVGESMQADPLQGEIMHLAYQETEEGVATAVVNAHGDLWVTKMEEAEGLMLVDEPVLTQSKLATYPIQRVSTLLIDGLGESLFVADQRWPIYSLEHARS